MKSDGNGGIIIHKGTFAAITLLIMLFSVIGTVVAYGTTIKSDVNYLKQEYVDSEQTHKETIYNIKQNQIAIIQNQERILSMHDDIKEIKIDVKELK